MRQSGVCPLCGTSVLFIVGDDKSRKCPVCGKVIDIDEVIEND